MDVTVGDTEGDEVCEPVTDGETLDVPEPDAVTLGDSVRDGV